jgi:hypothetical protein
MMTRVSKFMMAAAAATMSVAPAIAAPAAPSSVRAAAEAEEASQLSGDTGGIFLALAAGVAIIVAIIILGGEESDIPTSP